MLSIAAGVNMDNNYELFKEDEIGTPTWVETVGEAQLKNRLMKLTALKPGKYLIYDPRMGEFVEPFKKSA
jgi:hypothetical protein